MSDRYILYLIHNDTKDVYYIGQTNNWRRRAVEHGLSIPSYKRNAHWYYKKLTAFFGGNPFIKGAIEEGDKIEYTWLAICNSKNEVNRAEIYWIQTFKDAGYTLYNRTCGGAYDDKPQIKSVDISNYPKLEPLPLDRVATILQDKDIMREDRKYYGLEKQIHDVLIDQCYGY